MREWIIIIIFAITLGFVASVPTLVLHVQEAGVYTQDRVVYTFVATEQYGLSASSYVFPLQINSSYPAFSFFKAHSIIVAEDPLCQTPLKWWVAYNGSSEVELWVYLPSITSSETTTFYVCASTSNPSPLSGSPDVNGMFLMFDDFDGSGTISWQQGGPNFVNNTVNAITTESNGTLTMVFVGGTDTEDGLIAGTVNIRSNPYFIIFAKISVPPGGTGQGVMGGVFYNMSGRRVSAIGADLYIELSNNPAYNGFWMFFWSSDYWGVSYTYPEYYTTTLNDWVILGQWHFFGYYPDFYPALYSDNFGMITYTSTSLYSTGRTVSVGLFQLRWGDGVSSVVSNTLYVDWFAVVQYWGFPSLSYVGATIHDVLIGS